MGIPEIHNYNMRDRNHLVSLTVFSGTPGTGIGTAVPFSKIEEPEPEPRILEPKIWNRKRNRNFENRKQEPKNSGNFDTHLRRL